MNNDESALWLRHQFLTERGQEGGTRHGFKDWLMGHLEDLRRVYPNANKALVELASGCWRVKTKPKNVDQHELRFAGIPLPYVLRYGEGQDARTVLAEYATAQQAVNDLELKRKKYRDSGDALQRSEELVAAILSRAGGDMFSPLRGLQDGFEDVG